MDAAISNEFIKIYEQIARLLDDIAKIAKDYYLLSVIQYDEINNTPNNLSDFSNDCGFITQDVVDNKIQQIPKIDDSNYLKKFGEKELICNISTKFKSLKTETQSDDDSSTNVATTAFVHKLIKQSGEDTKSYLSSMYVFKDYTTKNEVESLVNSRLANYDTSDIVNSKIQFAISEILLPTKISLLLNDSEFITLADVPIDLVTSVNGQIGDVTILIPSVPTNISLFTNDVGYITDPGVTSVNNLTGAISIQENVQSNWNATSGLAAILNKPALKRVATTGDYNDLNNTPLYAGSTTAGGAANKTVAIPFALVDDTSTNIAFTATVDGITELRDGVCVYLRNQVVTSAANYTININGLGAKPVYHSMAAATKTTTLFNINYTMLFIYNSSRVDGGCWDMYYGYYSDSNSVGYQLRTAYSSRPTTDSVGRYRILFSSADNSKWVPATTSTSTNRTAIRDVCLTPIDPFGEIVYYSAATILSAGDSPAVSSLWQQYNLQIGYSFNDTGAIPVLINMQPVYIKCAPQEDGSAIIDAISPYVQLLPNVEDGKIYIYLGTANGDEKVELVMKHPVYYYKDGAIRIWNNQESRISSLKSRISVIEQQLGILN